MLKLETQTTQNIGKDIRQLDLSYTVGGKEEWYRLFGKLWFIQFSNTFREDSSLTSSQPREIKFFCTKLEENVCNIFLSLKTENKCSWIVIHNTKMPRTPAAGHCSSVKGSSALLCTAIWAPLKHVPPKERNQKAYNLVAFPGPSKLREKVNTGEWIVSFFLRRLKWPKMDCNDNITIWWLYTKSFEL